MNQSELLELYAGKSKAAGVEVERVEPSALAGCLKKFLALHAGASTGGQAGAADSGRRDGNPGSEPSSGFARIAALPATGWPNGLREEIASVLVDSGFEIVAPQQTTTGYAWDRRALDGATLGITFCDAFVADTGTLILASGPGMGTLASLMPDVHLVLSTPEACRESFADYLAGRSVVLPSRLSLITGPSRTGDIEMTMTTGVHGPRRVFHWILGTDPPK